MWRLDVRAGVVLGLIAGIGLGCAGHLEMLGAAMDYEEVAIPEERARLDLAYRTDDPARADKHRLDLFLPESAPADRAATEAGSGRPVVVFVHGGGWTSGDRAMGSFGIDPIRNLGRFLAAQGYVAVVPSYRLQPEIDWRDQVADVAAAVAWVREEISAYGGNPDAIHLGGHSAGAWLAARVGLEDAPLAARGQDRDFLCSLVLVSGGAYDLEDEETYALGASREFFVELFGAEGAGQDWARAASVRWLRDPPTPPSLLLTAGGEPAKFQRQSDLLFDTLVQRSPRSRRVVVPGQNHQRIMVGLALEGDTASEVMLEFLRRQDCTDGRAAGTSVHVPRRS